MTQGQKTGTGTGQVRAVSPQIRDPATWAGTWKGMRARTKGERTLSHKGRSANDFPEKYPCGRFFLVPTQQKEEYYWLSEPIGSGSNQGYKARQDKTSQDQKRNPKDPNKRAVVFHVECLAFSPEKQLKTKDQRQKQKQDQDHTKKTRQKAKTRTKDKRQRQEQKTRQ